MQNYNSRSDTPCLATSFLHHSNNTLAYRLPISLTFCMLHLFLYFTEILSIIATQRWYCSTLIHCYTKYGFACKDTYFFSYNCNFHAKICTFCLFFSNWLSPSDHRAKPSRILASLYQACPCVTWGHFTMVTKKNRDSSSRLFLFHHPSYFCVICDICVTK